MALCERVCVRLCIANCTALNFRLDSECYAVRLDLGSTRSGEPSSCLSASRTTSFDSITLTLFAQRYSARIVHFCLAHATPPCGLDDRIRAVLAHDMAAHIRRLIFPPLLLLLRWRLVVPLRRRWWDCGLPRREQNRVGRVRQLFRTRGTARRCALRGWVAQNDGQ